MQNHEVLLEPDGLALAKLEMGKVVGSFYKLHSYFASLMI